MKLSLIITFCFLVGLFIQPDKPTIYLVGDSTVKNGRGDGGGGLWGWGDYLYQQFDTAQVSIKNRARGGRSSRTYISEGLWEQVREQLQPGDFVIIQFGHNDSGNINDNHRARGTIKSNSEDSVEIDNILTGKHEVVHSYGWYIRKYVNETKSKGAVPIVCSLVARNIWEGENVIRTTDNYTKWALEAATDTDTFFIDLNDLVASKYEEMGQQYVSEKLFLEDHTHTTKEGAIINGELVADGVKEQKVEGLVKFLK